jgi:hypothetical protein
MDNNITYKYYKFDSKEQMPTLWPDNVDITEIVFIRKEEDLERRYIDNSWYVNVVYSGNVDLNFLKPFEITVKTPRRVWFGQ